MPFFFFFHINYFSNNSLTLHLLVWLQIVWQSCGLVTVWAKEFCKKRVFSEKQSLDPLLAPLLPLPPLLPPLGLKPGLLLLASEIKTKEEMMRMTKMNFFILRLSWMKVKGRLSKTQIFREHLEQKYHSSFPFWKELFYQFDYNTQLYHTICCIDGYTWISAFLGTLFNYNIHVHTYVGSLSKMTNFP